MITLPNAVAYALLCFLVPPWFDGIAFAPGRHQLFCFAQEASSPDQFIPTARLSNGHSLPLVGVGVGNLQYDLIVPIVSHVIQSESGYRLIDTAHASRNENLVADAIEKVAGGGGTRGGGNDDDETVHVVTKVWYTHLGYERTLLSAKESLQELLLPHSSAKVKVHMLLHWPRCDGDRIDWMDCEGEENRLPQYVKDAGPPPHLNKDNAWKDSWRALEDLYDERADIESIGVSNFDEKDMRELLEISRIKPHLYQGNVWQVVHDPHMMNILREHGIVFQAYNIMNGVIGMKDRAPGAYGLVEQIGRDLRSHRPFSPSRVILAWLVQNNISVIPRTTSFTHLTDNSPRSIMEVPTLTEEQQRGVAHAVSFLLRGEDFPKEAEERQHTQEEGQHVKATFFNRLTHGPIAVFWSHSETGEEIPVNQSIEPGGSFELKTHPGHVFVAYDHDKTIRREFRIEAEYGGREHFGVEL